MPNSIALATNYLPILDEIYKRESLSAILDTPSDKVRFKNANKVEIFKTSMDGLGDYSRNGGFVTGNVTGSWEEWTLSCDRGRSFVVDAMDDEESINMAFGTLVGEFLRTKVIPETDAYAFAKIAGKSGITSANADITVGTTDCVSLIDGAEQQLAEDEVPVEGRLLFVSPKFYAGIKAKITRYLANENGVQRNIEVFDGMPVIVVPQSRFNTAITLYDGTTSGEESGGFIPTASTGYKINFMICDPNAICKVVKHAVPRIFSPEVNQTSDGWKFDYRLYHDLFVYDNKVKGIYLHRASTANA